MPRASKTKSRVRTESTPVVAVSSLSINMTLEQRKKQAEEPIYLSRL